MKKLILTSLLIASIALTAACGGDGMSKKEKTHKFVAKLNAYAPAMGYYAAKLTTEMGGNWIVIGFSNGGAFSAINLDYVDVSLDTATMIAQVLAAGSAAGENVSKIGTNGNVYLGASGHVYEETALGSKDLEKAAAAVEAVRLDRMAQGLVADFGLSEERGFQVAKLALNWTKLSRSRAVTEADADAFSTDLVGFNLSQAEAAFAQAQAGDGAQFEALISQAAAVNGVSPEQMSRIVSEAIVSQ